MTSNQDTNKSLTREYACAAPFFPAFNNKTLLEWGKTMVRGLNYVDLNVSELDHHQRDLCRFEPVRTLPRLTPSNERRYFYLNVWHVYSPKPHPRSYLYLNVWRFCPPKAYPTQVCLPKCLPLPPTYIISHTSST